MKRCKRAVALLLFFALSLSCVFEGAYKEQVYAKSKAKVKQIKLQKTPKVIKLKEGQKYKLKVKVVVKPSTAANKKVVYRSSNKKVATVSKKGLIRAKKAGKAKITITSKKNKRKKVSVTVKVTKKTSESGVVPTDKPTVTPTATATATSTAAAPTATPTATATATATSTAAAPTATPTATATATATSTATPTATPTSTPTATPTQEPIVEPDLLEIPLDSISVDGGINVTSNQDNSVTIDYGSAAYAGAHFYWDEPKDLSNYKTLVVNYDGDSTGLCYELSDQSKNEYGSYAGISTQWSMPNPVKYNLEPGTLGLETVMGLNIFSGGDGAKAPIRISSVRLYKSDEKLKRVAISAKGTGNAYGNGYYEIGEQVTVCAEADENSNFVGWYQGDVKVSEDTNYEFEITDDISLEAVFEGDEVSDPEDNPNVYEVPLNLSWGQERASSVESDSVIANGGVLDGQEIPISGSAVSLNVTSAYQGCGFSVPNMDLSAYDKLVVQVYAPIKFNVNIKNGDNSMYEYGHYMDANTDGSETYEVYLSDVSILKNVTEVSFGVGGEADNGDNTFIIKSVQFVKDETAIEIPVSTINAPDSVKTTSASDGGVTVDYQGAQWAGVTYYLSEGIDLSEYKTMVVKTEKESGDGYAFDIKNMSDESVITDWSFPGVFSLPSDKDYSSIKGLNIFSCSDTARPYTIYSIKFFK